MNIKAVISKPGLYLHCLYNLVRFRINKIQFGRHVRLYGGIGIQNHGSIVIGNRFVCNGGNMTNPMGVNINSFFRTDKEASITIGNHVGMSSTTIWAAKRVVIENNVMIGAGTIITDTDAHSLNPLHRLSGEDKKYAISRDVIIRNGVFIGARCFICKGVEIGENSVIGACSVVTKSIPANEMWAGNPAVFVKKMCTD